MELEEVEKLAHEVIGAALEVHKELGSGYTESAYEEALCLELEIRNITFARQVPIRIFYKGRTVGEGRLDLLIGGALVVELKAVETLLPLHTSQLVSYLKMTHNRLGLLINFNSTHLKYGIKRVIR